MIFGTSCIYLWIWCLLQKVAHVLLRSRVAHQDSLSSTAVGMGVSAVHTGKPFIAWVRFIRHVYFATAGAAGASTRSVACLKPSWVWLLNWMWLNSKQSIVHQSVAQEMESQAECVVLRTNESDYDGNGDEPCRARVQVDLRGTIIIIIYLPQRHQ